MSENLKTRLRNDLIVARKARNKMATVVLTSLLSEVRYREIEIGEELDDSGVQAVVAKGIKQRKDAAQQMSDGGRPELAEKESEEASILQVYLPPALSEAEVRALVR
ncbi:MAG TPA: GatB/YqeY domain-containing protein, partial [Gemmatimonadetes bacterium]|nr:GatB/YqeY domain-containing protein [Gemmatimonadota bacterium]